MNAPLYNTPRPRAAAVAPAGKLGFGSIFILVAFLGAVAVIAQSVSIPVAGMVFAVGYLLMAIINPALAMVLMLGSATFNEDIGGLPVKMALSDLCMVLAMIGMLPRWLSSGMKFTPNPFMIPMAIYLLLCIFSTAVGGFSSDAIVSVTQMVVYMVAAVFFFSNMVKPSEIVPGLYALLATNCFLASMLVITRSSYVLGLHKNAAGTATGIGVLISFAFWMSARAEKRKNKLMTCVLLLLSLGLLTTLSRGAWLGTLVGLLIILALRRDLKLAIRAALIAAPVLAAAWFAMPKENREYATDFSSSARNIEARFASIDYAYSQFQRSPVFGVGVGLRKTYDATNVIMSTLAETGGLGLGLFLLIFVVFGWTAWRASRRLPSSSVYFTLMTMGAALMFSKFMHGLADHYWSRGVLPVWAGAGMVAAAYGASLTVRRPVAPNLARPEPKPFNSNSSPAPSQPPR